MRGRAYNRDVSKRKALRKKRISDSWGWSSPYYDNLHQYSKNKIHCSCGMCSSKTNQHHEHSAGVGFFCLYVYKDENGIEQKRWATDHWGTSHSGYRKNWKPSDLRKIQYMDAALKEWYNEQANAQTKTLCA